ncbi:MAG: hypothetical protein WCG92_20325 [Hyphomicrobiales bacterium]
MKQRWILAFAMLALPGTALAQGFEPGSLPPYEVLTIVRSTGLDPVGRPMRNGPNYVMHAIDNAYREVRVVISARSGEILSVTPLAVSRQMPPPRGGITMGPYERMPSNYAPPGAYRLGAPIDEGDDDDAPPRGYGVQPPALVPGAPLPRSSNAAPLPRGGAVPDDDYDDAPQQRSAPRAIPADPDRRAMLPPPPERFPQRAAPPAQPKPKPVTRAAAAPPKAAPLPKAKPAGEAVAPAQALTKAWPTTPAPSADAPAAAPSGPAAEETPH